MANRPGTFSKLPQTKYQSDLLTPKTSLSQSDEVATSEFFEDEVTHAVAKVSIPGGTETVSIQDSFDPAIGPARLALSNNNRTVTSTSDGLTGRVLTTYKNTGLHVVEFSRTGTAWSGIALVNSTYDPAAGDPGGVAGTCGIWTDSSATWNVWRAGSLDLSVPGGPNATTGNRTVVVADLDNTRLFAGVVTSDGNVTWVGGSNPFAGGTGFTIGITGPWRFAVGHENNAHSFTLHTPDQCWFTPPSGNQGWLVTSEVVTPDTGLQMVMATGTVVGDGEEEGVVNANAPVTGVDITPSVGTIVGAGGANALVRSYVEGVEATSLATFDPTWVPPGYVLSNGNQTAEATSYDGSPGYVRFTGDPKNAGLWYSEFEFNAGNQWHFHGFGLASASAAHSPTSILGDDTSSFLIAFNGSGSDHTWRVRYNGVLDTAFYGTGQIPEAGDHVGVAVNLDTRRVFISLRKSGTGITTWLSDNPNTTPAGGIAIPFSGPVRFAHVNWFGMVNVTHQDPADHLITVPEEYTAGWLNTDYIAQSATWSPSASSVRYSFSGPEGRTVSQSVAGNECARMSSYLNSGIIYDEFTFAGTVAGTDQFAIGLANELLAKEGDVWGSTNGVGMANISPNQLVKVLNGSFSNGIYDYTFGSANERLITVFNLNTRRMFLGVKVGAGATRWFWDNPYTTPAGGLTIDVTGPVALAWGADSPNWTLTHVAPVDHIAAPPSGATAGWYQLVPAATDPIDVFMDVQNGIVTAEGAAGGADATAYLTGVEGDIQTGTVTAEGTGSASASIAGVEGDIQTGTIASAGTANAQIITYNEGEVTNPVTWSAAASGARFTFSGTGNRTVGVTSASDSVARTGSYLNSGIIYDEFTFSNAFASNIEWVIGVVNENLGKEADPFAGPNAMMLVNFGTNYFVKSFDGNVTNGIYDYTAGAADTRLITVVNLDTRRMFLGVKVGAGATRWLYDNPYTTPAGGLTLQVTGPVALLWDTDSTAFTLTHVDPADHIAAPPSGAHAGWYQTTGSGTPINVHMDIQNGDVAAASAAVATVIGSQVQALSGTITATGAANTSITGAEGDIQTGTITANGTSAAALTGVDADIQSGTFTANGVANTTLVGVEGDIQTGTIAGTATAVASVTGVEADIQSGTFTANGTAVASITGVEGDIQTGNVAGQGTAAATGSLTGVEAAIQTGTIQGRGTAVTSVTGVEADIQNGTVNAVVHASGNLVGVEVDIQNGNVAGTVGVTAQLTGIDIGANAGSITARGTANTNVTGVEADVQNGTITAIGTSSATLTGVEADIQTGTVTAVGGSSAVIIGVEADIQNGEITATGVQNVAASLSGVEGDIQAGTISASGTGTGSVTLPGAGAAIFAGTVTATGFANTSVSGVVGDIQTGTVTVHVSQATNVNGVEGDIQTGTIVAVGPANTTVVGVEADIQAGTMSATASESATIIGAQVQISTGSIASNGTANVYLTGAQAISDVGAIYGTTGIVATVPGAEADIQAGQIQQFVAFANVPVTGAEADIQAGTIGYSTSESASIAGAEADIQTGSVVGSGGARAFLTGAQVTTSTGVVQAAVHDAVLVVGVEADIQAGEVSVRGSASVPIIGIVGDIQAGDITAASGSEARLTGEQMNAQTGEIQVLVNAFAYMEGVEADIQNGVVGATSSNQANGYLSGVEADIEAGQIQPSTDGTATIGAVEADIQTGQVVAYVGVSALIQGVEFSAEVGEIIATGEINALLIGQQMRMYAGQIHAEAVNPTTTFPPSDGAGRGSGGVRLDGPEYYRDRRSEEEEEDEKRVIARKFLMRIRLDGKTIEHVFTEAKVQPLHAAVIDLRVSLEQVDSTMYSTLHEAVRTRTVTTKLWGLRVASINTRHKTDPDYDD